DNFLVKVEVDLLVHILFKYEKAIAFTDARWGTFNHRYYPDYIMQTIPHELWQVKPLRLPQVCTKEIMYMLKEQMDAGKYEPSQSSYRVGFFAVENVRNHLHLMQAFIHDLQPLNIGKMLDSFARAAIYGIFDLKSGFDSCTLAPASIDLT
ncbi:uncharacterized protein EI90DRAFT_2878307, partial [Cantharellus anzutake]|uniref:uncharacterized protein n=1 Tax=Cantharellus anzutake TaxID=1750568 RepID=UPI00190340BA